MNDEKKKKWENFWYYYKYHTYIAIFIVIILVVIIGSFASRKESVLSVDLVGTSIYDVQRIKLQDQFTSQLVKNKKQTVNIYFLEFDSQNSNNMQRDTAVLSKIVATASAQDLDVLVIDKNMFKNYIKNSMFERIDESTGFGDLSSLNLKYIDGKENGDNVDYHYGIDVSDNAMLKATGYDTQDKVLGIINSSDKKDYAMKFVKNLFNLK
ncbi:MAG: hypothetical protein Q8900_02685 [Bacillota bacterium]|nr:hypothetical protein [Bacillota bacterium]